MWAPLEKAARPIDVRGRNPEKEKRTGALSRHIVAIYDSVDYVNHFLMFIKNNRTLPFEVMGFTSLASLEEYGRTHQIDILLFSRDAALREDCSFNETEAAKCANGKCILFLGETQSLGGDVQYLNVYRQAKLVLGDILDVFYQVTAGAVKNVGTYRAQVYGIYSLDDSTDKITAAMTLADRLSAQGPVLYINLEQFSGIKYRFSMECEAGISDLIYFFRTNPEMFRKTLVSAVFHAGSADILEGPAEPEDIDEVLPARWGEFLERLSTEGNYTSIILDVPCQMRNIITIFDQCRAVYMPGRGQTEGEDYRRREFRQYFAGRGREDILEKIREAI